ncbi:hypothetical protein NLJ89_g3881 [Agrocybe chaxingu]|uniref:BTB domain-containing protein n=1 Tax=Agrocybe chaxingu TaxID=84603 RepID=A0A9W8K355_9AGAR|nr:hypothetical protein NLJ89_g3881 [Agrocybe chaxingu]
MSTQSVRNQKYYFPDTGMAIFKVENNLYKVHQYFLIRESIVFKTMFDCANPPRGQDGRSDERSIYLPEVTCAEFEALLDFFYDETFDHLLNVKRSDLGPMLGDTQTGSHSSSTSTPLPPPPVLAPAPQSEGNILNKAKLTKLIDLLSISLKFAFDRLSEEIISAIDAMSPPMDPILKILLSLKHDTLRMWMRPALKALSMRQKPLTAKEMKALGPIRSAIICSEREKHAAKPKSTPIDPSA